MTIKTLIYACAVMGAVTVGLPSFAQASDYCREYTRTVTIGGRLQESYGTACLERDGSWRIVNESAPAPKVVYVERPPVVVYQRARPVVYRAPVWGWREGRGHWDRHDGRRYDRHDPRWDRDGRDG